MKNKLLKIATIALATISLTGCNSSKTGGYDMVPSNFETLCSHSNINNTAIYVMDKDTDIIYLYCYGGYHAAMAVYCNSEGQPMKYDEFVEVHMKVYHKGE